MMFLELHQILVNYVCMCQVYCLWYGTLTFLVVGLYDGHKEQPWTFNEVSPDSKSKQISEKTKMDERTLKQFVLRSS